jgi:hypothetical protein
MVNLAEKNEQIEIVFCKLDHFVKRAKIVHNNELV